MLLYTSPSEGSSSGILSLACGMSLIEECDPSLLNWNWVKDIDGIFSSFFLSFALSAYIIKMTVIYFDMILICFN